MLQGRDTDVSLSGGFDSLESAKLNSGRIGLADEEMEFDEVLEIETENEKEAERDSVSPTVDTMEEEDWG